MCGCMHSLEDTLGLRCSSGAGDLNPRDSKQESMGPQVAPTLCFDLSHYQSGDSCHSPSLSFPDS